MHELVLLMALLARAWVLLGRIEDRRTALDDRSLEELTALRGDLKELFHNPIGFLPAPVRPVFAAAGDTSLATIEEPAAKEEACQVLFHQKCADCNGDGYIKRFVGPPKNQPRCVSCDGTGITPRYDDGGTERDVR